MTSITKEDAFGVGNQSEICESQAEDGNGILGLSLSRNSKDRQPKELDLQSIEEELSISLSDEDNNRPIPEDDNLDAVSCGSSSKLNTTYDVHQSMPLLEQCRENNQDNYHSRLSSTQEIRDDADSIIKQQQQELIVQADQINSFVDQIKRQNEKISELEATIISVNRTCHQLECMLKQELEKRTNLENDNLNLLSEICKLRLKLNSSDQLKKRDDEKINLLNATLMERETEISILKLKLTRAQTNAPLSTDQSTSQASIKNPSSIDNNPSQSLRLRPPSQNYSITRLDNHNTSPLQGNNIGSGQQQLNDRKSSPSECQSKFQPISDQKLATPSLYSTPSNQPVTNNSSLPVASIYNNAPIYGNITSPYVASGFSQSLSRGDRRYRTLPRNMPSTKTNNSFYQQPKTLASINISRTEQQKQKRSQSTVNPPTTSHLQDSCTITNLDDSNESRPSTNLASSPDNSSINDKHQHFNKVSDNVNKQIPTLANSTHLNQSFDDESLYATIDKHGNSQSRSNSIMAHVHNDRALKTVDEDALLHQLPMVPKKSGLRRILNRFRRSGSGSAELKEANDVLLTINHSNSNFIRGGNRSTTTGAFQSISSNQQLDMNMPTANRRAVIEPTKPFAEWNTNRIAEWLTSIGLSMYSNQCRRWAKNGYHIMNATASEVERGLCISNTLHRKKLRLAISELNGDSDKVTKAAANMDYLWVARWLDDIGLPQYKEQFINNRIDGRVLNYLTVEDLVSMNITSLLHHASIRCGIRVLRSINFDLQALKRRATSDEIDGMMQWSTNCNQQQRSPSRSGTFTRYQVGSNKPAQRSSLDSRPQSTSSSIDKSHMTDDGATAASTLYHDPSTSTITSSSSPRITRCTEPPAALGIIGSGSGSGVPSDMPAQPDIALWTCHRVMEWLRLIDFSEFAPNLRGSGVHGGLIIYEDGFNADLMSSLLSIPDDKTLLRRHIYSLFKELIGKDLFQQKRQYESHPHYTPLTPTSELKLVKKSQFSLLRRSRSKVGQDTSVEEYLCPTYPIETRFKQHAAANAARDAAENHQQDLSMIQESSTYDRFERNEQSTRSIQLPSDSTIV